MSVNIAKVFADMGVFALIIVGALAMMGLAAIAVFLERSWVFYQTRKKARSFARTAASHLERNEYDTLIASPKTHKGNYLAIILSSGLTTFRDSLRNTQTGRISAIELAKREIARQTDFVAMRLRRGLGVLASVGSVAPFVGLLGTVVGIIEAFNGISAQGSAGIGAVSGGIAEALVVTAVGLSVAIPAVLMFNNLSAKADSILAALDQTRGEFVDFLEARDPEQMNFAQSKPVVTNSTPRASNLAISSEAAV